MAFTDRSPAFDHWIRQARAVPPERAAAVAGVRPDKKLSSKKEMIGPCPCCGGDDRFALKLLGTKRSWFNCRSCGIKGRDPVSLVMQVLRLDFLDACEALAGSPPDRPANPSAAPRSPSLVEAEVMGRDAWEAGDKEAPFHPQDHALLDAWLRGHAKAAADDRAARAELDSERGRAFALWREGVGIAGTAVGTYMTARGIGSLIALPLKLRCHPDLPFWHGGREVARCPAMLAPMVTNAGIFSGLHITWLDPSGQSKARLVDDETGAPLKVKKMRGRKQGCHIPLLTPEAATRLVMGEGIETVLSGAVIMAAAPERSLTAFWTACDLANLGGPSTGSVLHPVATVERVGREGQTWRAPQRVPGPEPETRIDWPAIEPPETVTHVTLLGDGDSEPFLTRNVIERARRRYRLKGLDVLPVFADDGMDFNDMLQMRLKAAA